MYLRNAWYVVGWSREPAERPLALTVMDEDLVIFRTDTGVHVLEDRCPHRHLPLSMGGVEGEAIRCDYHGMLIGTDGRCAGVPAQAAIPPRAAVRRYPAAERHGWIWAWMGDTALADMASIPDFSMLVDRSYRAVGKTNRVRASYQLVIDNLMDLSHASFVHQSTIGTPGGIEDSTLMSQPTPDGVRVVRTAANVAVPPTYVKSGVLPAGAIIDRWQVIDYLAPSFVRIRVGGAEAGTGVLAGRYEHGLNLWVMNAATPESADTSHYFWASVRRHALGDGAADALFLQQVSEAFEEDRQVLEAQQRVISRHCDRWDNALRADAGSIQSRRHLDRMIEREQASNLARPEMAVA